MSGWGLREAEKLSADLLQDLLQDRVAAVRIAEFLPPAAAAAAAAGIRHRGFDYYENVHPAIGRIGITQFEHRADAAARRRYFEQVPGMTAERQQVLAASGDLLQLVLAELRAVWPAEVVVAAEPDGTPYFAGLVRKIDQALLHCDWAPRDAPGWAISDIRAQLTWNIFCAASGGGATTVYRRPWQPADEQALQPGSYGYSTDLVAGRDACTITPANGDLVLFNSRNFHRVDGGEAGSDRISVSSFIGLKRDGALVLWS